MRRVHEVELILAMRVPWVGTANVGGGVQVAAGGDDIKRRVCLVRADECRYEAASSETDGVIAQIEYLYLREATFVF